jgi:hypothetical protein
VQPRPAAAQLAAGAQPREAAHGARQASESAQAATPHARAALRARSPARRRHAACCAARATPTHRRPQTRAWGARAAASAASAPNADPWRARRGAPLAQVVHHHVVHGPAQARGRAGARRRGGRGAPGACLRAGTRQSASPAPRPCRRRRR